MRLKTFHAATMQDAMLLVREQLGADAIIVATHEDEGARDVRVTAAVDSDDEIFGADAGSEPLDILDQISEALDAHGVPTPLADRLLEAATRLGIDDPVLALAGALDDCFAFSPLPDRPGDRPLMFAGPPGSGKTVGIAKLAVRTRLEGNRVSFITTDTVRAGAVEQLATYAKHLKAEFFSAADPTAFVAAHGNIADGAQILVDTAGVNPLNRVDVNRLTEFIDATPVDIVLVLAAGGDAIEAAEMSQAFGELVPSRLLVTRLDMVRRLGGILAAADASGLPFCDVSVTPDIASGLRAINPVSLARLLLPDQVRDAAAQSEQLQATGSN